MSWTQPVCDDCYDWQRPETPPHRLVEREPERCAWCGKLTLSGIFVRADPASVPYPASDA